MADLFEIGKSGVQSYRRALGVTGQNIANANTEGYNRRDAKLAEVAATQGDILSVSDQAGLGVRVENIRRAFDKLIVEKTNTATASYENARALNEKLVSLEKLLLPGEHTLSAYVQNFFDGLNAIQQAPTDLGARQLAIEYGSLLTDGITGLATNLKDFQNELKKEAQLVTQALNTNLDGLLDIQKKLISAGGSGSASNALLDQRDLLINELSSLVGISVDYKERGSVQISLGPNLGKEKLLDLFDVNKLSVDPASDRLKYALQSGSQLNATNQVTNGYLSGLSNAYSMAEDLRSNLNFFTEKLVKDFNNLHTDGITLDGQRGQEIFAVQKYSVVAEPNNVSSLTASLRGANVEKVYELTYHATANTFVDKDNQFSGQLINNVLSLNGAELILEGRPADGDVLRIEKSTDIASSLKFLIERPEAIAAATAFSVNKHLDNLGTSEVKVTKFEADPPLTIPKIEDFFKNDLNVLEASRFRTDLQVMSVSKDISDIEIVTAAIQPSVSFTMSDDISGQPITFTQNSDDGVSTVTFQITDLMNESLPKWENDLEKLVDLLNSGAISGESGQSSISLKQIGLKASTDGSVLTFTKRNNFSPEVVSAKIADQTQEFSTSPNSAGDVYIFTRDGRQIAGPALAQSKANEFITVSNGFYDEAEYRADYLETGFLNIDNQSVNTGLIASAQIPLSGNSHSYFSTSSNLTSLNSKGFDLWIADPANSADEIVISIDPGLGARDINALLSTDLKKLGFKVDSNNLVRLTPSGEIKNLSFSLKNLDGSYSEIEYASSTSDLEEFATVINLHSFKTGVKAEVAQNSGHVTLVHEFGEDIILTDLGSSSLAKGSEAFLCEKLSATGKTLVDVEPITLKVGSSLRVSGEIELTSTKQFNYGVGPINASIAPEFIEASQKNVSANVVVNSSVGGDQKNITFNFNNDIIGTSLNTNTGKAVVADTTLDFDLDGNQMNIDVSSLPGTRSADISTEIAKELRTNAITGLVVELTFDKPDPNEEDNFSIIFEGQSYTGTVSFPDITESSIQNANVTISGSERGRFSTLITENSDGSYVLKLGAADGVPTAETVTLISSTASGFSQTMSISAPQNQEALLEEAAQAFESSSTDYDADAQIFYINTSSTNGSRLKLPDGSSLSLSSTRVNLVDDYLRLSNLDGEAIDANFSVNSNVNNHIQLNNLSDDDFIVILDNASTSKFTSRYSYNQNGNDVETDLVVEAIDAQLGVFEIRDAATGHSLATRTLDIESKFSALGYEFEISGVSSSGDMFDLLHSPNGEANSDNIRNIIGLSEFDIHSGRGEFNQIFQEMVTELGMSVKSSSITKAATENAQQGILELKEQYSGVNLDTEAANLMEQQQAYQALARVLSTARDLLNKLMEVI
ncbi:MAG: flagellar hook-associated protein FlgK [Paracoccaceae bacterium]